MFFYLSLLILTVSLAYVSQFAGEKLRYSIGILILILLGAVASMRGFVGTDTYSYHLQFDQIQTVDTIDETALVTEPAFVLLGKLVDIFGGTSFGYVALIGILQTVLLVLILGRLENPAFFLMFYIPTFYINFHFNILREGTALLLIMLSLTRVKEGGFLFLITLWSSVFFHYSSFLFVPIVLIFKQLKEDKYLLLSINVAILAAAFYSAYLLLEDYMQVRALNYSEEEWLMPNIGIGFVLQIFLYIGLSVALFKEGRLEVFFFALPVILIKIIALRYPLLGRIEIFFLTSFLILLTLDSIKEWQGDLLKISLILLCFLNIYGVAVNLPEADNLYMTDAEHSASPYIPYHTLFDVQR